MVEVPRSKSWATSGQSHLSRLGFISPSSGEDKRSFQKAGGREQPRHALDAAVGGPKRGQQAVGPFLGPRLQEVLHLQSPVVR